MLSTLVAVAALVIAIAGRGSGHAPNSGRPPSFETGRAKACVTTVAKAQATERSAIVITATADAPVNVSEQAIGPRGIATVTRSEVVTARVRADEPVAVKRTTGANARACARGTSSTAARTAALRRAYARALADAHVLAVRQATRSVAALLHNQYPRVLAEAKGRAAARAHQLALTAGARLEALARAQARQRAGD